MAITADQVKQLRDKTGLPMMKCKEALETNGGDMVKAEDWLRKLGMKTEGRAGRTTSEGTIGAYVHGSGKLTVICEVNCETDFVARNPEFQELVKDICMQIAAMNPLCVSREEIPADVLERERAIYKDQVKGKPENIVDKIVNGKLETFYAERCLLDQVWIKDNKMTINELVKTKIAKTGEVIRVKRFMRWEVGK